MAQNFIQPKGSLNTKVDTSGLQQQLAQMFANQQLQGQAQAQAEAVDPMRQTVNELLKSKLMPVEMPQYATIQDIFKAPKGEKINKLGEFINTPSGQNILGGLVSLFSGGKYYSTPNDPYVQQIQHDMAVKQNQAMQQLKDQDSIVSTLNNAYMTSDIHKADREARQKQFEEEMKWAKEKYAQDLALEQQKINAQIQHQRAMEGLARERLNNSGGGGSVTGGAANTSNLTPKQIQKNQEMLNSLNAVQSQMDRFSNSFDKVRGRSGNAFKAKSGALLADWVTKGGWGNEAENNFNAQRTLLFNKIARELGGEKGVLSDQDIKRIEGSLPSLSDSLPQKRAKMKAVYDLLEDRKSQYDIGTSSGKKDSLGLGI